MFESSVLNLKANPKRSVGGAWPQLGHWLAFSVTLVFSVFLYAKTPAQLCAEALDAKALLAAPRLAKSKITLFSHAETPAQKSEVAAEFLRSQNVTLSEYAYPYADKVFRGFRIEPDDHTPWGLIALDVKSRYNLNLVYVPDLQDYKTAAGYRKTEIAVPDGFIAKPELRGDFLHELAHGVFDKNRDSQLYQELNLNITSPSLLLELTPKEQREGFRVFDRPPYLDFVAGDEHWARLVTSIEEINLLLRSRRARQTLQTNSVEENLKDAAEAGLFFSTILRRLSEAMPNLKASKTNSSFYATAHSTKLEISYLAATRMVTLILTLTTLKGKQINATLKYHFSENDPIMLGIAKSRGKSDDIRDSIEKNALASSLKLRASRYEILHQSALMAKEQMGQLRKMRTQAPANDEKRVQLLNGIKDQLEASLNQAVYLKEINLE